MKHYSNLSEKECRTREYFSDRVDNLKNLLHHLNVADECAQDEGLYLHGNFQEMRDVVNLAIRGVEEEALERGI